MALRKVRVNMKSGLGLNGNQMSWPVEAGEFSQPDLEEKKTLAPVPYDEANLEAELGEHVVTNLNQDGIPETYRVGGKRHYDGGTPLNLPEKSFIYSRDSKMKIKDKEILEQFGITNAPKGGVTPAEIAKKYDVSKYKRILLDRDSDKLQKSTAESMIINYNLKLGKLALLQESIKGFPNGIPFVAMPYLESAGIDPKEIVSQEEEGMGEPQEQGQMPMAAFGLSMDDDQGNPGGGGGTYWRNESRNGVTVAIEYRNNPYTNVPEETGNIRTVPIQNQAPPASSSQGAASTSASARAPETLSTAGNPPTMPNPYAGTPAENYWKYNSQRGKGYLSLKGITDYDEKARIVDAVVNSNKSLRGSAMQAQTPGFKHFYGDAVPQDYEYFIARSLLGKDAMQGLSEREIREKAFDRMGLKVDPSLLDDPQALYNSDWFEEEFNPAFQKLLPEKFRNQLGNDNYKYGWDYLDGIFQDPEAAPAEEKTIADVPKAKETAQEKASQFAPWWIQDIIKTQGAAADMFRIKKYTPWQDEAPVKFLQPTYVSPERELSSNAEQLNIGAQGAAMFTGPQEYNARFSQMAGQAAKNSADILSKYNNVNVGIANETDKFNVETFNKYAENKAANSTALYDKYTVMNQQFDNAKNQAREKLRQSYIDGITNAGQTQALNSLYPEFAVNAPAGGTALFKGKPGQFRAQRSEDLAASLKAHMAQKPAYYDVKDWASVWEVTQGFGRKRYSSQDPDEYDYNNPNPGYPGRKQ